MSNKSIRFTIDHIGLDHVRDDFGPPLPKCPPDYDDVLTGLRRCGVVLREPSELIPDLETLARLIVEGRVSAQPLGYHALADAVEGEPIAVNVIHLAS